MLANPSTLPAQDKLFKFTVEPSEYKGRIVVRSHENKGDGRDRKVYAKVYCKGECRFTIRTEVSELGIGTVRPGWKERGELAKSEERYYLLQPTFVPKSHSSYSYVIKLNLLNGNADL